MKLDLSRKTHKWLDAHSRYRGDECQIWPFSSLRGYGNLTVAGEHTYAHVVMCELVNGPAPSPDYDAAHSCGRGRFSCATPKHLSWKTRSQNQLDKREHGGMYRGGRTKKVSDDDVRVIRILSGIWTHDGLAVLFGCSRQNIHMIISRRSRRAIW